MIGQKTVKMCDAGGVILFSATLCHPINFALHRAGRCVYDMRYITVHSLLDSAVPLAGLMMHCTHGFYF